MKSKFIKRVGMGLLVSMLLTWQTPSHAIGFCKFLFSKFAKKSQTISAAPSAGVTSPIEDSYPQYLFGLEFTFTNDKIVSEGNRDPMDPSLENNPIKKATLENFWHALKEKCAQFVGCESSRSTDKHGEALKLKFADGFYFTVGNDSAVLEVNAQPQTLNGFKNTKHYLEEFVFSVAQQVGLKPHKRAGQGHIHISRLALKEDAVLLRNFFVDFQNRPEIIYGALGNHLGNSPPLAAEKVNQRIGLKNVLEKLDSQKYSVAEFVNQIHANVYTGNYFEEWGSFNYYQAFNMTRLLNWDKDKATIEIRSFRPQRNTRDFELQTKLLATWIEKLRTQQTLIPYNMSSKYEYSDQEIVNGFYELVQELGLDWEAYKTLLPDNLLKINPNGAGVRR